MTSTGAKPIILQKDLFLTTDKNNKNKSILLPSLHVPNSPNTAELPGTGNKARKHRVRPAFLLQRIELTGCVGTTAVENLSEFNLDSDVASASTDLSDGSDESSSPDDKNTNFKRLRLCSQSSTSSISTSPIYDLLNLVTDDESTTIPSLQEESMLLRLPHVQPAPNLAELEEEQAVINHQHFKQFSNGGLILLDNERGHQFELVGDGRNCKAVNTSSQTFYHCQILKLEEYKVVTEIMNRMQNASKFYSAREFQERSNLLLPLDQLRVLRNSQRQGIVFLLLPDHCGTLHQLMEENELSFLDAAGTGCVNNYGPARLSEGRAQPILRQIIALMEFCHRIGIFFKDFRLRKFVFTDNEKSRIRVNNILDLHLITDSADGDMMTTREFVPAYVAPEMLDKKNGRYAGGAADVWAFGVLMFTLLNGRYPFFESSSNPIELLRRIRAHRFTFPINESISDSARWLIHALLCPRPVDRPTASQLLQCAHWLCVDADSLQDNLGLAKQKRKNGQTEFWQQNKSMMPFSTGGIFATLSSVPDALSNNNDNAMGITKAIKQHNSFMFVPVSSVVQVPSNQTFSTAIDEERHCRQRKIDNRRHRPNSILLIQRQTKNNHYHYNNNRHLLGKSPPAFVPLNFCNCFQTAAIPTHDVPRIGNPIIRHNPHFTFADPLPTILAQSITENTVLAASNNTNENNGVEHAQVVLQTCTN